MLSVLIPCYNYNIVPLVEEVHQQCLASLVEFEILVFDDASKSNFKIQNRAINSLENCSFRELKENIGRSKIRNLLAKEAKYEFLLFIDAGTFPQSKVFIETYLAYSKKDIIVGGMIESDKKPKKPYVLRWLYTKEREKNTYCSSNFSVQKDLFSKIEFNESITNYGYEDVLFFKEIHDNGIQVTTIKNPVIHHSDEKALNFIKKTKDGIKNLKKLVDEGKLDKDSSKLAKSYQDLSKYKLVGVMTLGFSILEKLILKNLNSSYPSLKLFDFYRLGYYCKIKND